MLAKRCELRGICIWIRDPFHHLHLESGILTVLVGRYQLIIREVIRLSYIYIYICIYIYIHMYIYIYIRRRPFIRVFFITIQFRPFFIGLVEKKIREGLACCFGFAGGPRSVGWGKALGIGPRFNDESMGWVNVP